MIESLALRPPSHGRKVKSSNTTSCTFLQQTKRNRHTMAHYDPQQMAYTIRIVNRQFLSLLFLSSLSASSLLAQSIDLQNDSGKKKPTSISKDLQHILDEQAELRRDLRTLNQTIQQVQQRLEKLSQLADLQQKLDRNLGQIGENESDLDTSSSRKLKTRTEELGLKIRHLWKTLEHEIETQNQLAEVRELIQQMDKLPRTDMTVASSRYLNLAIRNLNDLKRIRTALEASDTISEKHRDQLEQEYDKLQERVDFDRELVEVAFHLIEATQKDERDDIEELTREISEIVDEMANQPQIRTVISDASSHTVAASSASESTADKHTGRLLKSGSYFIRQSWSQATDYPRPYFVNVPNGPTGQTYPVLIFLHGNGGNAREVMQVFLRNRRQLASKYIMVFAQGYQESWNIVSERSKADDKAFIESIVLTLASFQNVQKDSFSIMGASNGAALVNQLLIESRLSNIRNYISGVSPLNVWQYDGKQFKYKGADNNYREPASPMKGKRLLNISGTNDELVPYEGGLSKHIPAKGGKLGFLPAEESTYLWAKEMGETGEKLSSPSRREGKVEVFSYLEGDVVHYKFIGVGHGATHEISDQSLLNFLESGDLDKEK